MGTAEGCVGQSQSHNNFRRAKRPDLPSVKQVYGTRCTGSRFWGPTHNIQSSSCRGWEFVTFAHPVQSKEAFLNDIHGNFALNIEFVECTYFVSYDLVRRSVVRRTKDVQALASIKSQLASQ